MKQETRKFPVARWEGYSYNKVAQFDFTFWWVFDSQNNKVGHCERRKGSTLIFCYNAEGQRLGFGGVGMVNTAVAIVAEAHAKKQGVQPVPARAGIDKLADPQSLAELQEEIQKEMQALLEEEADRAKAELEWAKEQEKAKIESEDAEAQAREQVEAEQAEQATQILKRDTLVKSATGDYLIAKAGYKVMYFSSVKKYVIKSNNATTLIEFEGCPYDWAWVLPNDAPALLAACEDTPAVSCKILSKNQQHPSRWTIPSDELDITAKFEKYAEEGTGSFSIWLEVSADITKSYTHYMWAKGYSGFVVYANAITNKDLFEPNIAPLWYNILCADGTPQPANPSPTVQEVTQLWLSQIMKFLRLWHKVADMLNELYRQVLAEALKQEMIASIEAFNKLLNQAEKQEDLRQARQDLSDKSAAYSDYIRAQQQ